MINEESLKALIAAIDEQKLAAERIAQIKALDYVQTSNEKDRVVAKSYLRDAELWLKARALVLKYRGT